MTAENGNEFLLLKWGTVKGWNNLSEASQELMKQYFADGMSLSCAADRPDGDRRNVLCDLIDQLDGEIMNDWSGEILSKDEAKEYVRSFGETNDH